MRRSAHDPRRPEAETWGMTAIARILVAAAALALAAPAAAAPSRSARSVAVTSDESAIVAAINAVRATHGLVPVKLSTPLTVVATQHSEEMAARGYFAHESADGSTFWKRVQLRYASASFGYWSTGENLVWASPDLDAPKAIDLWMGENIAWGDGTLATPAATVNAWMHSPEHRANILNARWREIGISLVHATAAPGVYNGLDVTIVTTDFGVRRLPS